MRISPDGRDNGRRSRSLVLLDTCDGRANVDGRARTERISRRVPVAGASTSALTFSVSTSQTTSPSSTRSPTAFSQRVIVPSAIDAPQRGSVMSTIAMWRGSVLGGGGTMTRRG